MTRIADMPPLVRVIRIPIRIQCTSVEELDGTQVGEGLESTISNVFAKLSSRLALNPPIPSLVLEAAELSGDTIEPAQANRLLARIDATTDRVAIKYLPTARESAQAVKRREAYRAQPEPTPPLHTSGNWIDVDSHAQAMAEYHGARESGAIWTPHSRYQGIIYRIRGREIGVSVLRFPEAAVVLQGEFEKFYSYGLGTGNKPVRIPLELSADAEYEIEFYCSREPQGHSRAKVARFFEPAAREILLPNRKRFGADFNEAVQIGAEILADSYLKDQAGKVAFAILTAGGRPAIVGLAVQPPADLKAELVVLTRIAGQPAEPTVEVEAEIQVPGAEQGRPEAAPCDDPVEPELVVGTQLVTYSCEPFCGEPSLFGLGGWGLSIERQIDIIARELGLEPCHYAGQFVLVAARAIGIQALRIAKNRTPEAAQTRPTPNGQGNLGTLDLNFVESPQIQELRRLAAVVPKMSKLHAEVQHFTEFLGGHWGLNYLRTFNDRFEWSVGLIFKAACQVIFLQLLNASRLAIEDRQRDPGYIDRFRIAILPQLMSIYELEQLLDAIHRAQQEGVAVALEPIEHGAAQPEAWQTSANDFTKSLSAPPPASPETTSGQPKVIRTDDDKWLIRDQQGRVWNEDSLTLAIKMRRGFAEGIEPMIKQIQELPDFVADMGEKQSDVGGAVTRLLARMHETNDTIRNDAEADPTFAFNLTMATSRLEGIHGLAHKSISDAFGGDPWYRESLDHLIMVSEFKHVALGVLEFTAIVVLAIFCAPLVVGLVGVGLAAYHYGEAREQEEVYQALIDPEVVLSYADVEAQLFASKLGLVLAFIPIGIEVAGVARQAFRLFATEGVTVAEAIATAGRQAAVEGAEQAVTRLAAVVETGLARKLFIEGAKAFLFTKVIQLALTPVIEGVVQRYGEVGPVGGLAGALEALIEQEKIAMSSNEGGR